MYNSTVKRVHYFKYRCLDNLHYFLLDKCTVWWIPTDSKHQINYDYVKKTNLALYNKYNNERFSKSNSTIIDKWSGKSAIIVTDNL